METTPTLAELLESLCQVLDEELERQENVREICRSQHHALVAHDIESVEARTQGLEQLIRDAVAAEHRRLEVVRAIVPLLGMMPESATMTNLIAAAPQPWSDRLAYFQTALKNTVEETRRFVRASAQVSRRTLRALSHCMETLQRSDTAGSAYDRQGNGPAARSAAPALLDHRG
ncbi:MAG: hypothetical protein AMXMBFR84_09460 [Candidatus Hydrogenedentota bacterium]